jgi:hypothetical protein
MELDLGIIRRHIVMAAEHAIILAVILRLTAITTPLHANVKQAEYKGTAMLVNQTVGRIIMQVWTAA